LKERTCKEIADQYNIKVQAVRDLLRDTKRKQGYFIKKKEAEMRRAD
jgi:predicted DNA-binding protein YlxM (UPF0122 family)